MASTLNVTKALQNPGQEYLFEADDSIPLKIKEDENSAVGWVNIADIETAVTEEKMKPVYALLCEKMQKYI